MSNTEKIKTLRQSTGAGFKDCNIALKESNGNLEKAAEILRVKGIAKASKKMSREAKAGVIVISGNEIKTSLIEILSGRYKQKTGDVIYKDQIINNKPLYERARMGIGRTYQTPVVPEELTVGETLKAARQSTKPYLPVTDAEYAADLVKFKVSWDMANTKLETFNRRKLLMTSVLMREPEIILMDEPASGLINAEIDEIDNTLRMLSKEMNIAVLIVDIELNC